MNDSQPTKIAKSIIVKNPEQYAYNATQDFSNPIFIQSINKVIYNLAENKKLPGSEENITHLKSFLNDCKIESIKLVSDLKIQFEDDYVRINDFKISTKPDNVALVSFVKLLKIPYGSFYRSNKSDLNQEIIEYSLKPENFKNRKAELTLSVLVRFGEIIYVFSPDEKSYKDLESVAYDKLFDEINKNETNYSLDHFYNSESSSGSNKRYLFLKDKSIKSTNIGNSVYSWVKLIDMDYYTSRHVCYNLLFNELNGNFILGNIHREKFVESLTSILNYDYTHKVNELGQDKFISELVLIATMYYKIDLVLLQQAIAQQLELGGFTTANEFTNILLTFAKQFKFDKYFSSCLSIAKYIEYIHKYFNEENRNLIQETFAKK